MSYLDFKRTVIRLAKKNESTKQIMKIMKAEPNQISKYLQEIVPAQIEFNVNPEDGKFKGRVITVRNCFSKGSNKFSAVDSCGNKFQAVYRERPVGSFKAIVNEYRALRPSTRGARQRGCRLCGPAGSTSKLHLANRDYIEIPGLKLAVVPQNFPMTKRGPSALAVPFESGVFQHRCQSLTEADLKAIAAIAQVNLDLSVSFNYGKVAGCTIEEHIHVKIEPPAKLSIEDATESLSCPRSVHYPAPAIVLNSVTEATELRQLIANLQQANQAYNLLLRGDRAWIVGRTQLVSTQYLPGVKFASLEIGGLLILDDRRLLKQLNEERISRALEDVSLRMEVLKTFL